MVGGGGGKNISSIIITGLDSTGTITCTKDGKSYIATWDDTAQHWEIVGLPFGTFTVTATNGTKTKTETILIDIAGVYEIEMSIKRWLYRYGDECEGVTGGWVSDNLYGTSTFTKQDQYLEVSGNENSWVGLFHTANKISLDGYTKLMVDMEQTSSRFNAQGVRTFGLTPDLTKVDGYYYYINSTAYFSLNHPASEQETGTKARETIALDITDTSEQYVYVGHRQATVRIYNVWLE